MAGTLRLSNTGTGNGQSTITTAASGDTTYTLPSGGGTFVTTSSTQALTVPFASGTVSAPSVTFLGDSNTGIYSPGADTIAFTEGGVESLRIDSSGRVGIGTTSPSGPLSVVSDSNGVGARLLGRASDSIGTFQFRDNGDTATQGYVQGRSTDLRIGSGTGLPLLFIANDSERARIDSSGRLLVGTSSARSNFSTGTPTTQYETATSSFNQGLSIINNGGSSAYFPILTLGTTKSTSVGSNTSIGSAGDGLGRVDFAGADGTNLLSGASITAVADGTWGTNDAPTRLAFSTTADGASSPTERLRVQSSGDLRIANASTFYPATDNAVSLGSGPAGPFRFSAVWAANGTIQTSDKRDKTNVVDSQLGSDFIKSLRPVSYKWIEGGKVDTGKRDEDGNYIYESVPGTRTHWGFIAQEVKQVVDAVGVDFGGWVLTDKDDSDSQQALRYDQFIAPLTKALQETMAELEALKAEVAALKGA
jgi:hypothetical protein